MKGINKKGMYIIAICAAVIIIAGGAWMFGREKRMTAVVNTQTLKVRMQPDENAEVVSLIPEGTCVVVLEELENGFTQIQYDDENAYVMSEYITVQ